MFFEIKACVPIMIFTILGHQFKNRLNVVVIGYANAGKSTLLRMVSGLETIDQGQILLNDKILNDLIPSKREIAMVFQSYALYPHMNVSDV